MKFETWIKRQKHRDDPIGDLAKDFIDGQKIKPSKTVKESLQNFHASYEAWNTLKEAEIEFYGHSQDEEE